MNFRESMSSFEARNLMYDLAKGKSREEIERIKTEYKTVAPKIRQREMRQNECFALTSDKPINQKD